MFIPSYFSGIFSPVSKLILAQKIRLNPTKAQENFFWRCVGTARFTYNWGLNEWIDQYRLGGKPTESELRRYLNSIKKERYPWMGEVPKSVVQQAIKNLGGAYKNFFTKLAKRPKFKKKHKSDVTRIDRFFASSKTCSCCKSKLDDLPLNIRVWRCEACGTEHDRDVNAAINILVEGLRVLAEANQVNSLEQFPVSCTGCGGGSAGLVTQSLSGTLSNEARIER